MSEEATSETNADDAGTSSVVNIAFVRVRPTAVKNLSGFKKHHKVPDSASDYFAKFVAELADPDIEGDLEERFQSLKSAFRFKRAEVVVHNAGDGNGSIATPYFDYSITVALDEGDPSRVTWRHAVDAIKDPDQIFTEAFSEVFEEVFDTVEFTPPTPFDLEDLIDRIEDLDDARLEVDYDKDVTWCKLKVDGVTGTIAVTDETLSIVEDRPQSPKRLLESFLCLQRAMVDRENVSLMRG